MGGDLVSRNQARSTTERSQLNDNFRIADVLSLVEPRQSTACQMPAYQA
jgi:hypothetical protein